MSSKYGVQEERNALLEHFFLSKEWVYKIVEAIENAKATDEKFRSLTYDFSLSVAYVITDLSPKLKEQYGSEQVVIFIELVEGSLKECLVGESLPEGEGADFTIKSRYEVSKKIFLGELNPAVAFIKRQVKVEPFMKLYKDPAFTAKSIITANAILEVIRKVPTLFPE